MCVRESACLCGCAKVQAVCVCVSECARACVCGQENKTRVWHREAVNG